MPKKAKNPFIMVFDLKLNTSPELGTEAVSYFQSIISIFRWMLESGSIDIITTLLLLSSYLAMPRDGHLEAAVNIMVYMGQKYMNHHSLILNAVCSRNVIGQNFIRMQKSQYL